MNENYEVVYSPDDATWEHVMQWDRWLWFDREKIDAQIGRFHGCVKPIPKPGQHFVLRLADGENMLFEILHIEVVLKTSGAFRCDGLLLGYAKEVTDG